MTQLGPYVITNRIGQPPVGEDVVASITEDGSLVTEHRGHHPLDWPIVHPGPVVPILRRPY